MMIIIVIVIAMYDDDSVHNSMLFAKVQKHCVNMCSAKKTLENPFYHQANRENVTTITT